MKSSRSLRVSGFVKWIEGQPTLGIRKGRIKLAPAGVAANQVFEGVGKLAAQPGGQMSEMAAA